MTLVYRSSFILRDAAGVEEEEEEEENGGVIYSMSKTERERGRLRDFHKESACKLIIRTVLQNTFRR